LKSANLEKTLEVVFSRGKKEIFFPKFPINFLLRGDWENRKGVIQFNENSGPSSG